MLSYDRMNGVKLDQLDIKMLRILQRDASLSQRELAEQVNLSQNACWRRLNILREAGLILNQSLMLNRRLLGLGLVVFVMLKTRYHSADWLEKFRRHVSTIPEVVDFYRIGGEYDYFLKVVTNDMDSYDEVYQRLISSVELDSVTSYFAMEAIEEQRPLPL